MDAECCCLMWSFVSKLRCSCNKPMALCWSGPAILALTACHSRFRNEKAVLECSMSLLLQLFSTSCVTASDVSPHT